MFNLLGVSSVWKGAGVPRCTLRPDSGDQTLSQASLSDWKTKDSTVERDSNPIPPLRDTLANNCHGENASVLFLDEQTKGVNK